MVQRSLKSTLLSWLTPQDLSRVSQLQMFAQGVVEGMRGGMHRSKHIGASIDFKEHRPYVSGDEIRSMDWKVFGKTDRLYIRQYEDETNLQCMIIVDQSGSMLYAGTQAGGVSKHEYAIRLAACFAFLLVSQQDAVGLATFDSAIRRYIPPKSQPSHLHVLAEILTESKPGQETDLGAVLEKLLLQCKRRGIMILLSDCFGDPESFIKAVGLLQSHQQEVVVFQIMDDDEWDFPFQQRTLFHSLEPGHEDRLADPAQLRKAYLQKLSEQQRALYEGCQRRGIHFTSVRTSDPYRDVMSQYLARRRGQR